MIPLTRRRSDNPHRETWHVYFGDIRIGFIGERAGVPVDVDQWEWSCGFYPGLHQGPPSLKDGLMTRRGDSIGRRRIPSLSSTSF
jgi:hypothetical protein